MTAPDREPRPGIFFIAVAEGPARDLLVRDLASLPGVALDPRGRIPLVLAVGEEVVGLPFGATSSRGLSAFTNEEVAETLVRHYRRALAPVLEDALRALHGRPFSHGGFLTDDPFLVARVPVVWPAARVVVVEGEGLSAPQEVPRERVVPAGALMRDPAGGCALVRALLALGPAAPGP